MSKKLVIATAAALFLAAAGGAFDPTSAAGPVWPQGPGGGHPQLTPHGFGDGTPRFAHFNLGSSAVPFSGFNRFALSRPFGARYFWRHPFGGYAFGRRFGSLQVGRQFMGAYAPRYAALGRFAPGGTTQFGQIGKYHHGWYAWRRFQRGFVGWAGPVFWPYAYDDLFDYAFWPYDYEPDYDLFWAYGYDDLFAGILLPYDYAGLERLAYDISEGDCSGTEKIISSEELDGAQVARELHAQGSDPAFFLLTESGEDME